LKMLKRKTIAYAIALFLISSIAITLFALPNANAQSSIRSYPFVDAIPNPVGIGQRVLINYGALNYLNSENDGWNVTITITKPNGDIETLTPPKTWSTGTAGITYVPDQIGTYYLQTNFPQQWYNYTSSGFGGGQTKVSNLYLASQSEKLALVVQQDPIPSYPWQPLPTEYWTRPADSQLTDWYTIMGSWVATPQNLFAPYNDGPESAHILWSQPVGDMMGGLAGGDTGNHGYENGDAYEGKWSGSIIIGGVLYYNKYISGNPQQAVVAINLHTGKQLWEKTFLSNQRLSFGQTLYWDSRGNRAAFSYLWVSSGGGFSFVGGQFVILPATWSAFDALTGNWQFNMTSVPSGTRYYGDNGEILQYSMVNYGNATNRNYRLLQWNSSWVVTNGKTGMSESWGSQVLGVTYNATSRGYDKNVSIPALNAAGATLPGSTSTVFVGDKMIGSRVTATQVNLWAISLQPANMGTLLYNTTWTPPAEWVQGNISVGGMQGGFVSWSKESQLGVIWTRENRLQYGFDLTTGKYIWTTEVTQNFQDAWSDSPGAERLIAYGHLISASLGGTVYAYNVTTGKLDWTYNATDAYHESYLGNNWWLVPVCATDGKIYIGHEEHSALDPKPRGAPFFCLNATTGELIWRIDGAFRQTRWGGRGIIGDSIIATMDTYDQQVYAIGKGPSSTTVTAPDIAAPFGTPVVIKGTVLDVSPGTQTDEMKLRFTNGVPAVADESMSDWMLHVYKQFQRPTDAKGVKISIDAVDPNNKYIHIGDTEADSTGVFSYMFTPADSGKYTVFATFSGSAAYYPSFAQTALGVMEKPEAPAVVEPAPASIVEQYFVPAVAGIIIAVIAVGALLAILTLRKRQ